MNAATMAIIPATPGLKTVREALAGVKLTDDRPLVRQVHAVLRRMATEFRLLPNQLLSEKEVALGLDISKTPVREAFIRLAEDGVVVIVPHSGTYVAPMDADVAKEGCIVLSALYSSCAAKAAEQCSFAEVGRLRGFSDTLENAMADGEEEKFFDIAEELFDSIAAMAGIPDARALIDATQFEVERIGFVFRAEARPAAAAVRHCLADIVNAVIARDGERARRCAQGYFEPMEKFVASLHALPERRELLHRLNSKAPEARRSRS